MSLVNLRTLTNDSSAPEYNAAATSVMYAEDYNAIKKAIQQGQFGIYTKSVQIGTNTLTSGKVLDVVGASLFTGAVSIVGNGSVSGTLSVAGTTTLAATVVSSTLSISGATTIAAGGLTITAGGLAVTAGNISTGGGTAINVSTHDHSGGSLGVQLSGATAIADGTITAAKIASGAYGLTSGTIAEGSALQKTRDALNNMTGGGFIHNPIMSFYGSTNAGVIYPLTTSSTINLVNTKATVNKPSLVGAEFINTDIDLDSIWTSFNVPSGVDTTAGIAISFYFIVKTAPSVGDNIKLTGYVTCLTPGAAGDSTDVDLSTSALTASTTITSAIDTQRIQTLTVTISSGSYAGGDCIYAGVQRQTVANNSAQSVYVTGAKLFYNMSYA